MRAEIEQACPGRPTCMETNAHAHFIFNGEAAAHYWFGPGGVAPVPPSIPEGGEVSLADCVELGTRHFGGTWQIFWEKLHKLGYKLMKEGKA